MLYKHLGPAEGTSAPHLPIPLVVWLERAGLAGWCLQPVPTSVANQALSPLSRRMTVWLSTAPTEPLTHWYQVRCLFQSPLFAKAGDTLSGTCLLIANKR